MPQSKKKRIRKTVADNPILVEQWHSSKNGQLKPEDLSASSTEKVWWKCPEFDDHEWQSAPKSRKRTTGCPVCQGKIVVLSTSLLAKYPEVAAQWHTTKNGDLLPSQIAPKSNKKVWWKCPEGDEHEWEARVFSRLHAGCPACAGYTATAERNLAVAFPEIAAQWHPTRNGKLTPQEVVPFSGTTCWWKCAAGPDHEWTTRIITRTKSGTGCPCCANIQVSVTNSLATCHPDIAKQWHPTKNGDATPEKTLGGTTKSAWWICDCGNEWEEPVRQRTRQSHTACRSCRKKRRRVRRTVQDFLNNDLLVSQWDIEANGKIDDCLSWLNLSVKVWWKCEREHKWQSSISDRFRSRGCQMCGRKKPGSKIFAERYPELAKQWHPTKNGDLTPHDVTYGSDKVAWWRCLENPDHEWECKISRRTYSRNCPSCSNRTVSRENSIAVLMPELARQWHPTKNGDRTPFDVGVGSSTKVWWKCPEGPDHEWRTKAYVRGRGSKTNCPFCAGRKASVTNSLASLLPELAKDWHPRKNKLTPKDVVLGSSRVVWWQCANDNHHEWEMMISSRVNGAGCPHCRGGWNLEKIRVFVKSLIDENLLKTLTPAELWLLFQQNGLLAQTSRRSDFVKAFVSGRLSVDDLKKFSNGESNDIDKLFDESPTDEDADFNSELPQNTEESENVLDVSGDLPEPSASEVLDSLESKHWTSADSEAVAFLIASGVAKLWRRAYVPELLEEVVKQTKQPRTGEYSERVRTQFLSELEAAQSLQIPDGYSFTISGCPVLPNLMQRHVAALTREKRRIGNWSGTGAGKTLSAILASRSINAGFTVVLCPNSVVSNWRTTIENAFPRSQCFVKTLEPVWKDGEIPAYLILNYEMLQQPSSEMNLAELIENMAPDMIVIDEIHCTKQRAAEATKRRQLTEALCATASEKNSQLAVLGMSATPVVNNLKEGVSMINLVTGLDHSDIPTRATVNNCMRLHQGLFNIGVRWKPPYPSFSTHNPKIDIGHLVSEIRSLPLGVSGMLLLEQLLVRAKLPTILSQIEPGTVVFTQYVEGIVPMLSAAIKDAGWTVGEFTGKRKDGLSNFINGKVDVLIGSSAIGTGVDGLQARAANLIIASAPWTAAAYEQLIGRLVRQGQTNDVCVSFPITFANVSDKEWSWCQSRRNRIEYKKSISDAAVDGVVPAGHLRSPSQAFHDALGWLRRLTIEGVSDICRTQIYVPLSSEKNEVEKRYRRYGDFSKMNNAWNNTRSGVLHARLVDNSEEWANYHTLYREARENWEVVPYKVIAAELGKLRKNQVVGDFGCGEDFLGNELRQKGFKVHSFDHIAISNSVTSCDIGDAIPLADAELDVAVFSLSLMGANTGNYLREAARTLGYQGQLVICEATSRMPSEDRIESNLEKLGFDVTRIEKLGQFNFVYALRNDHSPDASADFFDRA